MNELNALKSFAEERRVACANDAKAYSLWLSVLFPANFLLVIGGALLALVAGTSLLVEQHILGKTTAGILALISSCFTIIHTKLDCDHHQAECRKVRAQYESLCEKYANLQPISDIEAFKRKLEALNEERAHIIGNNLARPWFGRPETPERSNSRLPQQHHH